MKFLFFALAMIVSSVSFAVPCDTSLHTLIYGGPHSTVGYELIPYQNGSSPVIWIFVTYKLYPKQEVGRTPVFLASSQNKEVFTGVDPAGGSFTVVIDTRTSQWIAPYMFDAKVSLDPNSNFFAQRINPAQPNMVGGGVLGRLDVCN